MDVAPSSTGWVCSIAVLQGAQGGWAAPLRVLGAASGASQPPTGAETPA